MDIYKVIYLDRIDTACQPAGATAELVTLSVLDADSADYSNIVAANVPPDYRILSSGWRVNGTEVRGDTTRLERNYRSAGSFTIGSKIIAICDTCLSPVVACNNIVNELKDVRRPGDEPDTAAGVPDLATHEGELSSDQLARIGFNGEPVLFGFDKSTLSAKAVSMLDSNIAVLKRYNRLKVRIVGYTDARGPAGYNQALSERRAKSVLNHLVKNGIDRSQITVVEGKGEKDLVNDCDGSRPCREAEHKKNRRVKVILISEKITQ